MPGVCGVSTSKKALLILINPYGGSQKAIKIYNEILKPMFEKSFIKSTVIITQKRNHAKELIQSLELKVYF